MSGRHHANRCHMDAARRGAHTGGPHRGDPHRGDPHRGPTQGTHTGDPHRGEGPTEDPPLEGRATQGTHTGHTQPGTTGPFLCSNEGSGARERVALNKFPQPAARLWPLQDIRLLRGYCARINHSFTPPAHPHCPPWCNTIAR